MLLAKKILLLPLLAACFLPPPADGENAGCDKIVFIKRNTYDSNHYYTEFINASWRPGGGIFALDTKSGAAVPVFKGLESGVVGRFDLSFDAKKIVFSFKKSKDEGYRIFEGDIASGEIRQLTFPEKDEDALAEKFSTPFYRKGTDDLDPCYLPDGGIAFVSTRPKFGVLCDPNDIFTVTLLYRMDADGKNIKQLSFGALSENSPAIMEDGRILYTRWEYVDKGASAVKALWAVRPDGTGSAEIYGLDIALPPTMIFGRQIPDEPSKFVFCGTPHYPQSAHGTIISVDVSKGARSAKAMKYITPQTDIRDEGGFHFRKDKNSPWIFDKEGKGELFRDPYPLSAKTFLVSAKAKGKKWNDPAAYALALLKDDGSFEEIYRDEKMSCFEPYPLVPRKTPHVLQSQLDETLQKKGEAALLIVDVYRGLENVKRGEAKYIRVLEQISRPWNAHRRDMSDEFGQQNAVIGNNTHLGIKALLGVVPIESDGSAYFRVPANKNIFLQVLDENFLALQTERTFINYMDGETRSCIGCHEQNREAAATAVGTLGKALALRKPPRKLSAQPDGLPSPRTFDFERQIQPIFDAHCVECHNNSDKKGGLDLRGERTKLFNVAYESLTPDRKNKTDKKLLGKIVGEIFSKITNVEYLPAGSLGARTALLPAVLRPDITPFKYEKSQRLARQHSGVKISREDFLKLSTWIDTNCQYYPSYWGARNLKFKDEKNFRPCQSYEDAISQTNPLKSQ